MKNFMAKQNLLQELATRLHIIYLSDLCLSVSAEDLHEAVSDIPVYQYDEDEWYQAVDYIAGRRGYDGAKFQSSAEARGFLMNLNYK